MLSFIALRK